MLAPFLANVATTPAFDVTLFVWLLLLATVVALGTRRLQLPYPLALVITGLVMGLTHWLPSARLEPHTLFTLFLPPLLFEAALNLHSEQLADDWLTLGVYSIVGTVIATLVAGGLLIACGLPWAPALLLGSIVAPTDPISVIALLRKLRADPRLQVLVEAESLFNDGVAVVIFTVVLGLVLGQDASVPMAVERFALVMAGGVAVGLAIGTAASRVIKLVDDHLVELMVTTIAAYGSYLAAEALHASGVIGVVAAGLVVGNYATRHAMSDASREAVHLFWEYAAFVVNAIVFLLIGLQADLIAWWRHPGLVAGAIAATLLGRAVAVYGLALPLRAMGQRLPRRWLHLFFWGGLRGALSLALALGLPAGLPYRDEILAMVFGYVLFSLLVQGLTVEPLVRRLGLISTAPESR